MGAGSGTPSLLLLPGKWQLKNMEEHFRYCTTRKAGKERRNPYFLAKASKGMD